MRYLALRVVVVATLMIAAAVDGFAEDFSQQALQLKAGVYITSTKNFEVGNGVDLAYYMRPLQNMAVETGIGYYRAENGATGFLSAIPLTVSVLGIIPLQNVNFRAGAGGGVYYKMIGGLTELPADHSEFSAGYHAQAGIEFLASNGLSLLLDGKYVVVDQGKFKSYDINHGGTFVYGGFALNF